MRFKVTYLDGTEAEVVRTASALRAFEKRFSESVLAALSSGRSYWADELAHHSLMQKGEADPDFDVWIDTVETITWGAPVSKLMQIAEAMGIHIDDEAAADPTGAAPKRSRGSSSKSP